jgi:kynurenine formamidase
MTRIIDLTITIEPDTGVVIDHPAVRLEPIHTHEAYGRANTHLSFSLHTGTHVDAPYHFDAKGVGVDEVPLERLIGRATKLDLRAIAEPKTAITVEDLRRAPGFAAPLTGRIVILHTGWVKAAFGKPHYYRDNPYLAVETAQWLATQEIAALAVDHSIDRYEGPPRPGDFPNHRLLLGRGIPFIEHLYNLDLVPQSDFQLIALPIKVRGADGGPARVIAVLD